MFETKRGGPEGFPWIVVGADGAPVAAAPDEGGAQRLAFLLDGWTSPAAAPAVTVRAGQRVPYGASRPSAGPAPVASAAGPWGGHERPQPGRVYDLSGLAGPERVARDVTDEGSPENRDRDGEGPRVGRTVAEPAAPAAEPAPRPSPEVAADGLSVGDNYAAGGGTVRRTSRGWAVAFPTRPPLHVRADLKGAGFRWDPAAGEWHGVRLPVRFLPVLGGAR